MTDKERAVIEAARKLDACWSLKKTDKLRSAINALDAEQENDMEYKLLAMDRKGSFITVERPDDYRKDENIWSGLCVHKLVDNPPSFLKPGQLWERMCRDNDISKCWIGFEWWNGYWWKLVEDHSPTESFTCPSCNETFSGAAQDGKCTRCAGEGEWITDRRPTYDDAWSPIEGAMCPEVMVWDRFGASRCCWDQVGGRPWQPVPFCLRTPPKKPKCEECEWYAEQNFNDRVTKNVCWLGKAFNPVYGMSGCKFKSRGE